jgi:hypothetical protein
VCAEVRFRFITSGRSTGGRRAGEHAIDAASHAGRCRANATTRDRADTRSDSRDDTGTCHTGGW